MPTVRQTEAISFSKPRPPRIEFADAVYHVISRGNGRGDVLSDGDRQRLLSQLGHHLQLTVSRHFGIDPGVLSSHGHHAGRAKGVAVTAASRLAEATGGQRSAPARTAATPTGLPVGEED